MMAPVHGSQNVAAGAIDIDSPEFAEQFGGTEDVNQDTENGNIEQVPEIIRDMMKGGKKRGGAAPKPGAKKTASKKPTMTAAEKRAAEKEAKAKKAAAQAEKDRKAAERDDRKRMLQALDPVQLGLVGKQAKSGGVMRNIPLDQIDGIDGGDPVEKSFVDILRVQGVQTPIVVREMENGRFNVLAGKRRSQASRALAAEGLTQFATIPAVIQKQQDTNDYIIGLSENYARSNNIIEEHRMVVAVLDHLKNEFQLSDTQAWKALSKATGLTMHQIKAARDVGRLLPELQTAVEEGAMGAHAALNASRLDAEIQRAYLVSKYESEGRVTADDVTAARKHKQSAAVADSVQAAQASGQDMFTTPETAQPVKMSRVERVAQAVIQVQGALTLLQGISKPTADEADSITLLEQIVTNLTTAPVEVQEAAQEEVDLTQPPF
jgi:ParB-like chromosome segregation protein Spo0J